MSEKAWSALREACDGIPLPAAFVDLDALERNVDATRARMHGSEKSLRVASKSVRHAGLLRRIMDRGGDTFRGVMCFSAVEADYLADQGFDDLLVAYPTVQRAALDRLASRATDGVTVWFVVDCEDHLRALSAAGARFNVTLSAVLEVDVSYRPFRGRVHLGTRRSPIRTVDAAIALARAADTMPHVRMRGLMAYEAHVAGLPDDSPFDPRTNHVKRALKRVAMPAVVSLRTQIVSALRADGHELALVNGGGTGSVHLTSQDDSVTEVSAGSGFLCPHLFDYFVDFDLEPAAFFALEVCRRPAADVITCGGGGYVASGPPGLDRLPLPWLPAGLEYLSTEAAGEVQTPLQLPDDAPSIAIGDPVFFRHAKAGELAERFGAYRLLRGGRIQASEPTYRGDGVVLM